MKIKQEVWDKGCCILALLIGVACAAAGFTVFELLAVVFVCVIIEMLLTTLFHE